MNEGSNSGDRNTPERDNPDHEREEVPGRPAVSGENLREQEEEASESFGDRLRRIFQRLFRR